MLLKVIAQVSKSLRIGLLKAGITGVAIGGGAWMQVLVPAGKGVNESGVSDDRIPYAGCSDGA